MIIDCRGFPHPVFAVNGKMGNLVRNLQTALNFALCKRCSSSFTDVWSIAVNGKMGNLLRNLQTALNFRLCKRCSSSFTDVWVVAVDEYRRLLEIID
ncbi:hypothetical protein CDAR_434751 [Caerostris darwini]|uniref:Mut7-C RNAse domain-containing protein n=1 Tax=Caerostris darwini TaxID=1538125 RepID=A0AAV4QCC7_9ARAC|nr:hypothetical protein CDAR_434751 [Caerostris darwini]